MKRTKESNYITNRSFVLIKSDKINCPTKPEEPIKENIAQKLKLAFVQNVGFSKNYW